MAGVPRFPDRRESRARRVAGFLDGVHHHERTPVPQPVRGDLRHGGLGAARCASTARPSPGAVRNTMPAVGIFLLIAGWRLFTVFLVLREDRREAMTLWDEPLAAVFRYLLVRPEPHWPDAITGRTGRLTCPHQLCGPVVVGLMLLSLLRGWRWWHILTVVSGWLAIGSNVGITRVTGSSTGRSSARPMSSRAGDSWPCSASDSRRAACWHAGGIRSAEQGRPGSGVTIAIASGFRRPRLSAIAAGILRIARPAMVPGPAGPRDRERRRWHGLSVHPAGVRRDPGIRADAQLSPRRPDATPVRAARVSRRGLDARRTRSGRRTEPQPAGLSSPARSGGLHQPESGLMVAVNGRRIFADRRCAEPMLPFAVRADDTGRLELRINPPGPRTGVLLHLLVPASWLWRG